MALPSFSLLLPNLFIGLCNGTPLLKPYSAVFCRDLGYRVHRFEPSFKLSSGGRANPDLVLASTSKNNTLLIEWTEATSVSSHKEEQLHRYSKVNQLDLTDVLAVPISAATTHDVTLIVPPGGVDSFEAFLSGKKWSFALLGFAAVDGKYSLEVTANGFQQSETDAFFRSGIHLTRVPLHYLPIPLDQITRASVAAQVVRHLVSLIHKGVGEVTVQEFCVGWVPLWSFIDVQKQHNLMAVTRDVLTALARKPFGKRLLRRIPSDPPAWQLSGQDLLRKQVRSVRTHLDNFIAEQTGESYQPELPLDETSPI